MAERRVAEVMTERDGFGKVLVEGKRTGYRAGDLGYCYFYWGFNTGTAAVQPYEWLSVTVPSSVIGIRSPASPSG